MIRTLSYRLNLTLRPQKSFSLSKLAVLYSLLYHVVIFETKILLIAMTPPSKPRFRPGKVQKPQQRTKKRKRDEIDIEALDKAVQELVSCIDIHRKMTY